MKRLVALFAACILLFCGCGGETADLTPVRDAMGNMPDIVESTFTMNIVFGDERTTLLFAMGSFAADREKKTVDAKMTRTVLASASAVELHYDGEVCTTIIDGETHTANQDAESIFGSLIYARPFLPDDGYKYTSSVSKDGLYTVKCKKPDSARLFGLLGDDIYSIAYISVPRRDKMYCEDAVFTYRIKNGIISDYGLSFKVHLFDTPPYVPGMKVDESDYELVIDVSYVMSVK